MSDYVLYVIDYCPHCHEAVELLEEYGRESGIDYEIVRATTLIEKHPQDAGLVKRVFAVFSEDKKQRYNLPACPALWDKKSNELIVGVGAIDYLKKKSGEVK